MSEISPRPCGCVTLGPSAVRSTAGALIPPMRKLTLAALLLTGSAMSLGCRHGSAKLEGHWKGVKAEGVPEAAMAQALVFAQATEIIARSNQIAIQTPAGRHEPTTYFIDKEDATTLVIHTERDGAETFTFSEKADTMVWRIDAARSITFRKVR